MCPKCLDKQRAAIQKARAAKLKAKHPQEAVTEEPAMGK
jgi:hypothetical protein